MKNIAKYSKGLSMTVVLKSLLSGIAILFLTLSAFAQTNNGASAVDSGGVFSNALFLVLLGIVILLLIIISVLGGVLKSVASYYTKSNKSNNGSWIGILLPFLFLISPSAYSQEAVTAVSSGIGGLETTTFNALVGLIILELLIITVLVTSINILIKSAKVEEAVDSEKIVEQPSLLERLNASVAIEKEEDILLDHNYDGIRELDNNLPPWWKYGFYLTIIIGVVYLINYHVIKTGDLQIDEYKKEVALADKNMEEYRKKAANLVDETNVKLLSDNDNLAKGKEIYISTCAPCHGQLGEGMVGPNLTDDYWIHGGSLNDIFKTIKYGYPEKGMKSWENELSPLILNQVSSFIKTLHGTNPPNAKEKQGDLYNEKAISDSTVMVIDSLTATPIDTTAKK